MGSGGAAVETTDSESICMTLHVLLNGVLCRV
jgi:hypothetical protein